MSTVGAFSDVPASMHGESGWRWKSNASRETKRGSSRMLPIPGQTSSPSMHEYVARALIRGLVSIDPRRLAQTMEFVTNSNQ